MTAQHGFNPCQRAQDHRLIDISHMTYAESLAPEGPDGGPDMQVHLTACGPDFFCINPFRRQNGGD